jgi:hypothetical protein
MEFDGRDIDDILQQWPYDPLMVNTRMVRGPDGRTILQLRIEMGVLQMETKNRPDGLMPGGCLNYLDYLKKLFHQGRQSGKLLESQCHEVEGELAQFYHRRICWLALRRYAHALVDADYSLAVMDYVAEKAPSEKWRWKIEKDRPLVQFHHTQAAAMDVLDRQGPVAALALIREGMASLRQTLNRSRESRLREYASLIEQLQDLQQWIRDCHNLQPSLQEQLEEAIGLENYELAARLRDKISRTEGAS